MVQIKASFVATSETLSHQNKLNIIWKFWSMNEKLYNVIIIFLLSSVLVTFRTVFWSIFGRGDTDVLSLGEYQNNFTEDIGYIIYGVFNIVTVTVLINMFIAVMTRSFQNIAVRGLLESSYYISLYLFELDTVLNIQKTKTIAQSPFLRTNYVHTCWMINFK